MVLFFSINLFIIFIVFCSKHKHFLLTLLSIEFMALLIFFMIFYSLSMKNIYFSLIYLTFTACEGALGLSILVDMSRTFGSDFISLLNFSA